MNDQIERKLFIRLIQFVREGIEPGIEYNNDRYLIELDTKLTVLARLIEGLPFIYDEQILDAVCGVDKKGEEDEP